MQKAISNPKTMKSDMLLYLMSFVGLNTNEFMMPPVGGNSAINLQVSKYKVRWLILIVLILIELVQQMCLWVDCY